MSGFFCILVVPNCSGDGVRRCLSRRPPRRCSASRSAVPSTPRAAITAVYSGWFSIKITIVHDIAEGRSCTPFITQTVAVLSIQFDYMIS